MLTLFKAFLGPMIPTQKYSHTYISVVTLSIHPFWIQGQMGEVCSLLTVFSLLDMSQLPRDGLCLQELWKGTYTPIKDVSICMYSWLHAGLPVVCDYGLWKQQMIHVVAISKLWQKMFSWNCLVQGAPPLSQEHSRTANIGDDHQKLTHLSRFKI